ncbi:MAG TPA: BON domain-containing protein [Candidatus Acidoferrum sp.]
MRFTTRAVKGLVILFLGAAALATALMAGPMPKQDNSQQPAPDNSKTNKRDRDKSSPTADRQKMNATDRDLAKRIRSAIVDDKSLSTYAHNIKIVAQDGKVTLKGPVRSEEEKSAIEAKATEIAGAANVINQLEVAPPKS